MANHDRLDLHKELLTLFTPNKVYHEPPESVKLTYPCIVYFRDYIKSVKADDRSYVNNNRYQLTVIDRNADNPIIRTLMNHFVAISYDRHFVSDGLHHDVLTLYY